MSKSNVLKNTPEQNFDMFHSKDIMNIYELIKEIIGEYNYGLGNMLELYDVDKFIRNYSDMSVYEEEEIIEEVDDEFDILDYDV